MGAKLSRSGWLYEPLNNYIVDVENKEGEIISFKVLAHTTYHAREKIYAKFCHIQDDISKYSMGVSALLHSGSINSN